VGVQHKGENTVDIADVFLSLAVAAVLSNWHNILRAINMASSERTEYRVQTELTAHVVKIPPSVERDDTAEGAKKPSSDAPLPQTLVRIPTQSIANANGEPGGGTGSD
jgi:hypothetical protein